MAEFGYLTAVEVYSKESCESMIKHILHLQDMYTILPEHAKTLKTDAITSVYQLNGITNFHDFLYKPENMIDIHNIMKHNSEFASQMANVVKQDIINTHQDINILQTNEFINKGIKLATPLLGGVLGLIAIHAIDYLVPLAQAILI
jgi:hypothetical protein